MAKDTIMINGKEYTIEDLAARIKELEATLRAILDNTYEGYPEHKSVPCPHGRYRWEICMDCIKVHVEKALK